MTKQNKHEWSVRMLVPTDSYRLMSLDEGTFWLYRETYKYKSESLPSWGSVIHTVRNGVDPLWDTWPYGLSRVAKITAIFTRYILFKEASFER